MEGMMLRHLWRWSHNVRFGCGSGAGEACYGVLCGGPLPYLHMHIAQPICGGVLVGDSGTIGWEVGAGSWVRRSSGWVVIPWD